jgi:small subunit ribosomal protein S11
MADEIKEQEPREPQAAGAVPAVPTAEGVLAEGEKKEPIKVRKSAFRGSSTGIAHILASFNNTVVSISDPHGGVIAWSSSGRAGFKGSRKSTAFAATVVGQEAARVAVSKGMTEVEVRVQGPGAGRESAIRALQATGLAVSIIKDLTPMPHNGCRPRKRRRV